MPGMMYPSLMSSYRRRVFMARSRSKNSAHHTTNACVSCDVFAGWHRPVCHGGYELALCIGAGRAAGLYLPGCAVEVPEPGHRPPRTRLHLVTADLPPRPNLQRRPRHWNSLEGWWFREDKAHFDYWAQHAIPHIVILRCLEDDTTYWVQVKPNEIVDTGNDAKILVPSGQKLTEDSRAELLRVVSEARSQKSWEGTIWGGSAEILPEDQLRTALLTPRLIAPHPNHTGPVVTPREALAMLVQLRLDELDNNFRTPNEGRTPLHPASHDLWEWRLYASLRAFVSTDDADVFVPRVADAPGQVEQATAIAMYCAALHEKGRVRDALAVIEPAFNNDELYPRDRLWLGTHYAWTLLELGRATESRQLAADLQVVAGLQGSDPTAGALSASLANLIFATSRIGEWDLASILTASDTSAEWWREQALGQGALARVDLDFEQWSEPEKARSNLQKKPLRSMRSACLMAAFAANRGHWHRSSALVAREQLLMLEDSDPDTIIDSLSMLRRAGEDESVTKVARRLLRYGPASALRDAANQVNLNDSTRSSVRADMALLRGAGDVLTESCADATLTWMLGTIDAPLSFIQKFSPTFRLPNAFLEVIADIALALSNDGVRTLSSHLASLPTQIDQLTARTYGQILNSLPPTLWPAELVTPMSTRMEDNFELRNAIDRFQASRLPGNRPLLVPRISNGDLDALHAYGDVRDLPSEVAASLVASLSAKVEEQIAQAGRSYTSGDHNPLRTLLLMSVNHATCARWDLIVKAIEVAAGSPQGLSETLRLLANVPDSVPVAHKDTLVKALRSLAQSKIRDDPWDDTDVGSDAKDALNVLDPGSVTFPDLLEMLQTNASTEQSAVLIIARQKNVADLPILAVIAEKGMAGSKAVVAHCLAKWVCDGVAVEQALPVLERLLQQTGTVVARSVINIVQDAARSDGADTLAQVLGAHTSAQVRRAVARYLGRPA